MDASEVNTGESLHQASVLSDVVFAPIGGQGLVQQTVRRLAEGIRLGLLEEGERLPPEVQLAGWFGISAMTLREALAILREAGLLETHRGRGGGTFVKKAPAMTSRIAAQVMESPDFLRDLVDYRKAITGEAAALAAERATAKDCEILHDHAVKVTSVEDLHDYLHADGVFHICVAELSRSNRLLVSTTTIEMELNRIAEGLLVSMESRHQLLATLNREHSKLVEAIASGNAHRARTVMQAHANGGLDFMMALYPSDTTPATA